MLAWKVRVAVVLVTLVAALGMGAAMANEAEARTNIRVMLRNLYLGTDPILLAAVPTQEGFRRAATTLWRQVKRTDFPARSRLIAKEIDDRDPHLIGLQEVTTWRRSDPGQSDGDTTPATNVRFDFLKILLRSLRERDEHYKVVEVQREADLEGRTSKPFDIRFTMHDVILARRGTNVEVRASRSRNFRENLVAPTAYGPEEVTRGWTATDVVKGDARLRFVNTHLEAYSGGLGVAQAEELTQRPGALATDKQTILLGDFNSDPKGPVERRPAYRVFKRDGFSDAWLRTHGDQPGLTYGFNSEVKGSPASFTERIDHIFFRNGAQVERARRFGLDPDNRLRSGRWPADHAGLFARFSLRE